MKITKDQIKENWKEYYNLIEDTKAEDSKFINCYYYGDCYGWFYVIAKSEGEALAKIKPNLMKIVKEFEVGRDGDSTVTIEDRNHPHHDEWVRWISNVYEKMKSN